MDINIVELDDINNLPSDDDFGKINRRFLYKFAILVSCVIFLIFIFEVFNLSVLQNQKFKTLAYQNLVVTRPIVANRGVIFSRGMKQLSFNVPSFELYLNIHNLSKSKVRNDISILSKILHITPIKITNIIQNGIKSGDVEIPISSNISKLNDILITSNTHLKGVNIKQTSYVKFIYNNLLSHIIGYTGPITEQDILSHKNVSPYDIVGRYGVEESYNKYLSGKDGLRVNEVNTFGKVISSYGEKPPIPGDNIQLNISATIQKEMQTLLYQSIKTNPNHVTGAVGVVENVHTGGILAMVSLPTFNNNLFEKTGISSSQYSALINNPEDPLLNRAIQEQQPVGSIMKTILLSGALQDNVITPNTYFTVPGVFVYDGVAFQNYAKINWGIANVVKCLQFSINVFAFKTSLRLGIQRFVKFEKLFGMGQKTGINLPGEASGYISDPHTKMLLTNQSWVPGDLLNAAIGQGYTEVTPIQVVNWISAIANGGTLYKPRIVKNIYNQNGKIINNIKPQIIRKNFVSSSVLAVIRQGMYQAVQNGIDIAAKSVIAQNAGKSGTAQFGVENVNASDRYSHSHSWMSSFAPYNNPQIAVVVFEQNGGLSTYAAEVVKNFMNWYFGVYLKSKN